MRASTVLLSSSPPPAAEKKSAHTEPMMSRPTSESLILPLLGLVVALLLGLGALQILGADRSRAEAHGTPGEAEVARR